MASYSSTGQGPHAAVMAEWLRRWTRNPMGSSRAGSNPAHSVRKLQTQLSVEVWSNLRKIRCVLNLIKGNKLNNLEIFKSKVFRKDIAEQDTMIHCTQCTFCSRLQNSKPFVNRLTG